MERFVVDASVAVAWVHPGQATVGTNALLANLGQGTTVIVPALWPVEVANALLVLERRGKITPGERVVALTALRGLVLEIDHEMTTLALTQLSQIAADAGLSVYDAAYLELAHRLKLPLACKDGPLRTVAQCQGLIVVP